MLNRNKIQPDAESSNASVGLSNRDTSGFFNSMRYEKER